MSSLAQYINAISNAVWGPVLIIILVGTGVYMTFRLKFVQISHFAHAFGLISGKYDNPDDEGDITHFQALSAALSATIGTGNIAGVATAIAAGGPGAVFWMWITAFFGMALKYASCLLSMKYRVIHEDGSVSGGPMYYLEKGLGWKWLAVCFAFFTMIASLGIGNMVQANSVADPLHTYMGIPEIVTGIVMAVMVFLVIVGGIRRIGHVAAKIVPFMCIVYIFGAIWVLIANINLVGGAFAQIFVGAFSLKAGLGGLLGTTIRYGVARGVFSNEAGLGSAPIAHAAAKTKEPVREGLVAMIGPFIDTIVICTMTALVIILTGAWKMDLNGAALSASAFEIGLPGLGKYIVAFGLVFFAFSTALSWSYYGDRCAEYLFGEKAIRVYRVIFVLFLPLGATMRLGTLWSLADIGNALMAFPNLIGVIALSGVVVYETRKYIGKRKK